MKPKLIIAIFIFALLLSSAAFAGIYISKSTMQQIKQNKNQVPVSSEKPVDYFSMEKEHAKQDDEAIEQPAPLTMTKEAKASIFRAFLQRYVAGKIRIPPGTAAAYPIEFSPEDREAFASVDIAKYQRFQSGNRGLFHEMQWQSPSGASNSIVYSQKKMQELAYYIGLLETGADFPYSSPPTGNFLNVSGHITRLYTEEEAWRMYVPQAAMLLYVEVNHLVPWSILDYGEYERSLLIDGRKFINYDFENKGYRFYIDSKTGGGYLGVTDWNPFASYKFLQDNAMVQPTQQETIYAITQWVRVNIVHEAIADQFRNREKYGYPGYYPVDKILSPPAGARHWTQGCSGTTSLYKALLRTINIPVSSNSTIGGHRSPVFVTADMALGHADDVYSTYNKRSPQEVPVERIFLTMQAFYDMNHASPDDSRRPNNADVAGWLNQKKHTDNAYEFKAYGLLEKRGFDVLYPHLGAQTLQYWWKNESYTPLYDDTTISSMIANIDTEITRIGEGNYSEGYREIAREIVRSP